MKIGKVFAKLAANDRVDSIAFGEKNATVTLKAGWLSQGISTAELATAHLCRLFIEAAANPDVAPVKRGRKPKAAVTETPVEYTFAPGFVKSAIELGDIGSIVSEGSKKVKLAMTAAQVITLRGLATAALEDTKTKQSAAAVLKVIG